MDAELDRDTLRRNSEHEQRLGLREAADRMPFNADKWAEYQSAHESKLAQHAANWRDSS